MFLGRDFFFYSSWRYLLLHLGGEGAGGRESYPPNDISNKYIYDGFLMIYLSILLLLFFYFLVLQGVNQRFAKAIIL